MARKAITIEDRVLQFCIEAQTPAEIERVRDICTTALAVRSGKVQAEPPKRQRKPKEAPQAKLAGVE